MIAADTWFTQLFFYLAPHLPLFDVLMLLFSAVAGFGTVWIMSLILLIIFEERKNQEFAFFFLIGLFLTFYITSYAIKPVVRRPRPLYTIWSQTQVVQKVWVEYPFEKPVDYSFPSAHASTSFFAAAFLSFLHKKYRRYFYLLAVIISYSRVYLGVHYLLDVIAGALLGWVIAWLTIRVFRVDKQIEFRKSRLRKKK